jgi:Zn-dependent M28 family amino/carboxypeptidase
MNAISMKVRQASSAQPAPRLANVASLLATISQGQLRAWVERISVPRHFVAEAAQNKATADWLFSEFKSFGYRVVRQGPYSNIVALPETSFKETILVGAHYDSVPMCPGADDNGSAVAALLGCAVACSLWRPAAPVVFVAFNREEEGLAGSRDFVKSYLPTAGFGVRCAHVLEMVGYADHQPGSQRVPPGLPIDLGDRGDFLGLVANRNSGDLIDSIFQEAGAYVPELPVSGLAVPMGLEKLFPVLLRSDHASFWEANIPSILWTDTSEYRNANYHTHRDTPETLDYEFLLRVTLALTASVLTSRER